MTNSAESTINWGLVIGGLSGCGAIIVGLAMIHHVDERRRKKRRERPPQPEKVLRPAGYYLQQKLMDLWDDLLFAVMQTIAAGVLAGITLGALFPILLGWVTGRFTFAQIEAAPKAYMLASAVAVETAALLWAVRGFLVIWRLYNGIAGWRFGLRGEQAVAEALSDPRLAAAGYVVFHDMPAEAGEGSRKRKWNVDHLVVGPGGVFVLETKTRPRRKATRAQEEDLVIFDGHRLQFPWCYDDKGARQAAANARWVRKMIRKFAPDNFIVQPVVVMPGWFVKSSIDYAVWAMNAKYLVGVLLNRKASFNPQQLQPVVARLDEECRVLEF